MSYFDLNPMDRHARDRKLIKQPHLFLVAVFIMAFSSPGLAFETLGKQAILVDAKTGAVLFEKNADQRMPPSSMSKIMTVYKLFEALKNGGLSLTDTFNVSEKAWRKGGSKMFVRVNSRVKVEDLIRGIIVQSGNDATIVVAEGLAGSEDAFAGELNTTARRLGMTDSNFTNASGWPDPDLYTTARDLARAALATIKNFPEFYHYYKEKSFTYNGIRQANRNPTLYRKLGADGLKTGHTRAAGYGLTTSAVRNGRRLVLVINGLPNAKARAVESERILDWGFRVFDNYALFQAGETVTEAQVWMGQQGTVPLNIRQALVLTLPKNVRRQMKVSVVYEQPIPAPIRKGDRLAKLKVTIPGRQTQGIPLYAGNDVMQLGLFSRLGAAIKFILWGESG